MGHKRRLRVICPEVYGCHSFVACGLGRGGSVMSLDDWCAGAVDGARFGAQDYQGTGGGYITLLPNINSTVHLLQLTGRRTCWPLLSPRTVLL